MNETDTFADEEGLNDEYFDFEDISGMVLLACSAHPCCWVWQSSFSDQLCVAAEI